VHLPLLLYSRGAKLQGRQPSWLQHDPKQDSLSTCIFYTYSYRYNYLRLGEHAMALWNLLYGGSSCNGPLLGPFKSMRSGTPCTNPRQQPLSACQVSRCWVIRIFLVCEEFAEYSISRTKYSGMKLLSAFSPN
jgi:hypothetical protein